MTSDQATAIITLLITLVTALTALVVQLRGWKHETNSRMTELLDLTRTSSIAAGRQQLVDEQASRKHPTGK